MKKRNNSGTALISVVFSFTVISFLALLSLNLNLETLKTTTLLNQIISENENLQISKIEAISQIETLHLEDYQLTSKTHSNFMKITNQDFISAVNLTDYSFFPSFDFNDLLKTFTTCDSASLQANATDSLGNNITAGAYIASETCIVNSLVLEEDLLYKENIYFSNNIDIKSNLIISAGFININGILNAKKDLTIISASDINIKDLNSSNYNLTVISTKGLISIDKIIGEAKLRLISKHGFVINGKVAIQDKKAELKTKEYEYLSLKH